MSYTALLRLLPRLSNSFANAANPASASAPDLTGLPDAVWRARHDFAIPGTKRPVIIRKGQLVLDRNLVMSLPEHAFVIAGWRWDTTIRLIDSGPEWLFRSR